jgi:hypothetical protein
MAQVACFDALHRFGCEVLIVYEMFFDEHSMIVDALVVVVQFG